MPFLTLEDPNARIKGSRDPLGMQPIWGSFARHVVHNVTSAANSVRGFTLLILGRYYGERLVAEGDARAEDALDIVLRMEQIGAYVRHVGHGVEGDIRGIERVKKFLEEHKGRVWIQADPRGLILADQRVYGIWGLFSVSARASGLIPEGPLGVTPACREFVEKSYVPSLEGIEPSLMRLLRRGGRLDTRTRDPVFSALQRVLSEDLSAEEEAFYAYYVRDAEGMPEGSHLGRQTKFCRLLAMHSDLTGPILREEVAALREASASEDEALANRLDRILRLEALLAPAHAAFEHIISRVGQTPKTLARELHDRWGSSVPNLDPTAFTELLPEIEKASSADIGLAAGRTQAALAAGDYEAAVRSLLDWNQLVMAVRGAGPWARVGESNRIDVRYRGAEQLLPDSDELGSLWRNTYFFDSLKRISDQLRRVA